MTVNLEPPVLERLSKLASKTNRSLDSLVDEAVREFLELHEWQLNAIDDGVCADEEGRTVSHEEVVGRWQKVLADNMD